MKNEEIKEIKEILESLDKIAKGDYYPEDLLYYENCKILLDYITNLQQDLEKANDIIKKDRQFYKCRMDEYVKLKKENERLNNKIKEQNLLLIEFQDMEQKLDIYKSRCEKANKIITDFMCTEEYCSVDPVAIAENYMEIQKALNGSDEMKQNNHNTHFYSIQEVERCLKSTEEFEDGEQLFYFIGALRYVYDENKKLKECYCNRTDCSGRLKDSKKYDSVYQEKEDYKSRCEKVIEYINFVINHYKEQLKTPIEDTYFDSDVNRKGYILSIIAYLQTILDTLNGSDENDRLE